MEPPMDADESARIMTVGIAEIRKAAAAIKGRVVETPCLHSRTLSEITGARVYLKFENHQFTASFKERGALNKLLSLTKEQAAKGVIAVSAGNHAQGVAYHAHRLGIPAVMVMPKFTPNVKVEHTARHGAEVILHGADFDEAKDLMRSLAVERGLTIVHPYDDEMIIAGQGTAGLEMLEAHPDIDTLAIAIGGGGLVSGISIAAKAINPGIEVIGVETERYPSMLHALEGTKAEFGLSTIAEGIAVKEAGMITREIVRKNVSGILLVDEGDIEQAIVLLLEVEKTVVEGAGAASLAAMLRYPERFKGKTVGIVLCGGNIDPLMLAEIIHRGMVRSGRMARIRIEVRDLPGALAKATACLAELGANVDEVHHQRAFTHLPVQNAEIDFVVKTRNHAHVQQLVDALSAIGFKARVRNFES
jgi:threonine dehydratase